MIKDKEMKKYLLTLVAVTCSLFVMAQVPAFPGAEGHGRYVTGGRGGKVIHVTNLNNSGAGSLREAVKGSDKKIVVFDVGGVIALSSDLVIGANTSILGQTAPSPGITIRYYTVRPEGNNIIIRFLRVRRGEEKNVNDGADAIWTRNYTGIMIDHCSFSWSIDEVASFYDNNNFTMQWCTLGESLNNAGHDKGAHGYGGIWGGKLASFHHNMICHVNNRSPRFNGARYNWSGYTNNKEYSNYNWNNAVQAEHVDFRNCVIYNCGNGCYGGPGGGYINMVNNYYKTGPAGGTSSITQASVANSTSSKDNKVYWDMFSRYYISGNQLNSTANADWGKVKYDSGTKTKDGERYTPDPNHYYGDDVTYENIDGVDCVKMKLDEPTYEGEVTTHTAGQAFDKVLAYAGASLYRDDVDERYAKEANLGTATYTGSVTGVAGRIDKVADVKGYTEANFGSSKRAADFDADNDGMADEWEKLNGGDLDPDAYDLDDFKKYYTNFEVYVNSLVEDIIKEGNSDAFIPVAEHFPDCIKLPSDTPTPEPADNQEGSVIWPFDEGNENHVTDIGSTISEAIASTSVTLGSELSYDGKVNVNYVGTMTKIKQNNVNATAATDENAMTFSLTTNKGYQFKATGVFFSASRLGTDRGKIDAKWIDAGGTTPFVSGETPNRNNADSPYTRFFQDLQDYSKATEGTCSLVINLYELSFNNGTDTFKDVGFASITIIGTISSSTGITTPVTIKMDGNGNIYNLNGQQGDRNYKGIVIKNGRKYIQK